MRKLIVLAAFAFAMFAYGRPLLGQTPLQPAQPVTQPAPPVTTVPGTMPTPDASKPSTSAVVTTTVPSPAAPQNPMDQVIWAGAMSYLLRYLMKKGWVLGPKAEARIKTQVGFLVALGTAAGIHLAVNGAFFSTQGVAFTITGISADAIKDVGFQWLSQQAWYDVIVKKVTA